MTKYVDEKAIIAEHNRFIGYLDDDMIARLNIAIQRIPAADVRPNIKGYWIKTGQSFIYPDKFICYSCSECGYDIEKTKFNYCPNCGAKMEGKE